MTEGKPETHYCIRCDEPGSADEMRPLYRFPEPEEEPVFWVHRRCTNAHGYAAFGKMMGAITAGVREQLQAEASEALVDITKRRQLTEFGTAASAVVASSEKMEAARADLERLGIDPDDYTT